MNPRFSKLAILAVAAFLSGCGGGGAANSGSSSTTTTTDMGSAVSINTSYQLSLKNAASSLVLGISGSSQTAGTSVVQEAASTATCTNTAPCDSMWHAIPMGSKQYVVENMLTHQVLGIQNASKTAAAPALQYADNGTADHNWQFFLLTDGNYLIQNVNSGLYLEVANSSTSTSATIDQGARSSSSTGCTCQEWTLTQTTTSAYPLPRTVTGTGIYVHDPYLLQDPNSHLYWLYGTHQTIAYSEDLTTFTYTNLTSKYGACQATDAGAWITSDSHCPVIGPDFTSWSGLQTPKSDNSGANTDLWAPSLQIVNGTYYQYYSIPYEPSTGAEAVIGLATSATPYGPWTDQGYLITSWTGTTSSLPSPNPWGFVTGTTWNAIDPAPFQGFDGKSYLVFGSWEDGTRVLEVQGSGDANPGFPVSTDTSTWTKVAERSAGEEGPFIYPYTVNGTQYYYYFAPINVCCAGVSSTYRTIVGRSTSPTGPFLDRGGIALTAGGGTILVSTHDNVYGPGGGSVFTDTGSDGSKSLPTFVYHYYDGNNNGTPTLGINRLAFTTDGWPYIE